MKIKTGDKVKVIAGKDKGKEGTVIKTFPKTDRVIVEGLNLVKKHVKSTGMDSTGGINEVEASMHVSNVMIVDPSTGDASRIGTRFEDGKKVRYSKKSGEAL